MSSFSVCSARHRILIVDDHPAVRQGLILATSREPDLDVCGEAARIQEALRLMESDLPDVVIIDLSLDGEDGVELIDYIKSRWPAVKILVYSSRDEEMFAERALRAGAMGYVSKCEPMPTTVVAVRQILRGEVYLSPQITSDRLHRAVDEKSLDQDPFQALSNRQLQVFELMGQGMNTVQIAQKLQVSPKTVESHRKVIKTKLNVQTIAQLSRLAFQWVQTNPPVTRGCRNGSRPQASHEAPAMLQHGGKHPRSCRCVTEVLQVVEPLRGCPERGTGTLYLVPA